MKYAFIPFLLIVLCCGHAGKAHAQNTPSNSEAPIEITATKTVEWLRGQKQYVARENVIVTQGTMTLKSDLLTADYKETESASQDIWQLTAAGNVQIQDAQNMAYGDKGVYDVKAGIATLTGSNLKLVSPDQTVTATQKMEYFANTREARATGNAKVIRASNTLMADTLTAFFKDNTQPAQTSSLGGGNLDRLEAKGNVIIKTPKETLRGAKAIYRADTNTAEILGNVKIEQGENVLEGDRAEVNLTTNVSKMFGSDKPGGRVRGVFFPGKNKDNVSPTPAQKTPTLDASPNAKVSPRIEY